MLEETTKNKSTKKVEATEEVKKDTKEVEATKEVEPVKEPRMGVARFLQINRQEFGIAALLKKFHGNEVMTETEWKKLLDNLLNKKITE